MARLPVKASSKRSPATKNVPTKTTKKSRGAPSNTRSLSGNAFTTATDPHLSAALILPYSGTRCWCLAGEELLISLQSVLRNGQNPSTKNAISTKILIKDLKFSNLHIDLTNILGTGRYLSKIMVFTNVICFTVSQSC
ncbi:hypothetical protein C8P68_103402 [Mucilaginibacter yixingensis]|uniref:Uncharacterized protein n=1 Tax=Mucilaginibacter yixingensis TaxID=1295612 RepID=A0A2T5JBJ3_9SPHI|nr:hypothetical protein C8P68_103402 [Mucilaginibacter yixingensis]